ncbi:MAG: SPOR domain-containing protein [Crocinitomicaceae bacterium]|nr:SPOR domain-containing protein [Crocinitomicaceae bacterium]
MKLFYSILIVFCCLLFNSNSFSQGHVEVIKDPRIDNLIKKQSEVVPPATSVQISGYRLQIFFDSDKSKVDHARIQFSRSFPKIEAYVTYNAPNYFLRVGDFRTSAEADRLKAELGSEFPTSFIVQEKVNLPRID